MKLSRLSGTRGPFLLLLLLLAAITYAGLPPHWATAHEGERVYQILEITDDMLAQIDLRDGTTDEWPPLLGEPTLRTIDFQMSEYYPTEYDPSDLDFAIWLGWHEESNRIYFAGAFVDDLYWDQSRVNDLSWTQKRVQDSIVFFVDGDHSGPDTENTIDVGRYRLGEQFYAAAPWTREGPTVFVPWVTHTPEGLEPLGDWMVNPPYCNGGGSVSGENPTIWSMEFFVTPFDLLVPLEPDECVVSDLKAGEVIGLNVYVKDKDSGHQKLQGSYKLGNLKTDAILLSRDQVDSVVRGSTWGRIQAALEMGR